MVALGPSGISNNNHITRRMIQTTRKATEKGIMVAMMVPIPALGSYF